jgi:uncharacterized FlaG/YvyC family protein
MLEVTRILGNAIPVAQAQKGAINGAGPVPAGAPGAQGTVSPAAVQARVEAVNAFMSSVNVDLRFDVSDRAGSMVIFVVDGTTGDVIRRIPPEYFLQATLDLTGAARSAGVILDEGA